jgi:hypothetical protein
MDKQGGMQFPCDFLSIGKQVLAFLYALPMPQEPILIDHRRIYCLPTSGTVLGF